MENTQSNCCGGGSSKNETVAGEIKHSCCGGAPRLVFACSGASDVGAVADQAARRISRMRLASMGCLAAVANGIDFAMDPIKAAERIIVIDGCPENCAKSAMEKAKVTLFDHVSLSELGMEKGRTKVDQEHITRAYEHAEKLLASEK